MTSLKNIVRNVLKKTILSTDITTTGINEKDIEESFSDGSVFLKHNSLMWIFFKNEFYYVFV